MRTVLSESEAIYRFVNKHPGVLAGYLHGALGLIPQNIPSKLIRMELKGFLLCEDDQGRLFPHSRQGIPSKWLIEKLIGVDDAIQS
ncbi:MAG: hypothetical protein AMJ88_13515 [Anaerolineae bacterium SM23_ 63]|nr:MAG: hypothetical protein AMJ88_13515 [Anaerolineae bacterium SM23_ 63]